MGIVRSKEPIRLFKSDVLEFFTHIHPAVVLVIWLPVVAYFGYRSVTLRTGDLFVGAIPVGLVLGVFLWTLVEYIMHRFVFHFRPRNAWQERVSFLFHGVHHAQPLSKTRLVMPPAVSIPLAGVVYGVSYMLVVVVLGQDWWINPLFAGLLAGYVIYDMFHYTSHHLRVRWAAYRQLRRHHLYHHTQTPDKRFGVTSPLWDIVFGTMPRESDAR
jgi:sterol desaturase/sphingolipid hydroxylase (fatty acid hydroxylase superfamily)